MKEAYVSYETSLLLDEKGFKEETAWYYNSQGVCEPFSAWVDAKPYDYSPMPTLQMACAWLREKGIEIDVYLSHITEEFGKKTKHYVFSIVDLNTDKDYPEYSEDYHYYPTYEEAVEAALKYTLENLIK